MAQCLSVVEFELFSVGSISDEQRNQVQQHLAGCAACRAAFDQFLADQDILPQIRQAVLFPPSLNHSASLGTTVAVGRSHIADRPNSHERKIPSRVGPVTLVNEVGRGGMSVVYRGRHDVLNRDVAVKFLLEGVDDQNDPGFVRFLEGARAAARTRHPSLTTIYHADLAEEMPYIVMEYVDGPSLHGLIESTGPIPIPTACAIIRMICEAIGELHSHQIIHRDIKPKNILLDWNGNVYVTDFGLTCHRHAAAAEGNLELAGTPAYMAPEMFSGQVSLRSDVYALGIVAYQIFTGRIPFVGSVTELEKLHAHEPLPAEPLTHVGIPKEVIEVIGRATHKDALFRFKSAELFFRAFRAAINDAAIWDRSRQDLRDLVASYQRQFENPPGRPIAQPSAGAYFQNISAMVQKKRENKTDLGLEKSLTFESSANRYPVLSPIAHQLTERSGQKKIFAEIPCIYCHYNLRHLLADGKCPECGHLIHNSLNPNRLMFAERSWFEKNIRGLVWWEGGIIGYYLFLFFFVFLGLAVAESGQVIVGIIGITVVAALNLATYWCTAPPRGIKIGRWIDIIRRSARGGFMLSTSYLLVKMPLDMSWIGTRTERGSFFHLASVVTPSMVLGSFLLLIIYQAYLCHLIPNRRLRNEWIALILMMGIIFHMARFVPRSGSVLAAGTLIEKAYIIFSGVGVAFFPAILAYQVHRYRKILQETLNRSMSYDQAVDH